MRVSGFAVRWIGMLVVALLASNVARAQYGPHIVPAGSACGGGPAQACTLGGCSSGHCQSTGTSCSPRGYGGRGLDPFGPYFDGYRGVAYRHSVNRYGCVRDTGVCGSYRPVADIGNGMSALAQPCRDLNDGMTNLFARGTGDRLQVGCQCGSSGYRARAYGVAAARECSSCGRCGGSVYWPAPATSCMPGRSFNPYSPISCPPDRSMLFSGYRAREFYAPVSDLKMLPSPRCDNGYTGPHADRRGIVAPQPAAPSSDEGYAPATDAPYGDQSAFLNQAPVQYSSRRTAR